MSEQNEPLTPERACTRIETLLSDIATRLDDIARHLDTVRYEVHMQTMTFARSQLRADRDRNGKSLRPWYGQVYSQNGEDGMIAEIFRRLGGPRSRVFIEIGAGDGMQNNTRFLLEQGWRGLWIEGSAADAPAATETFHRYVETGELQIAQLVVTPQNVNEIVAAARLPDEVDFLSVDIDQHTHTIWEAPSVKARVHCVEYNGSISPSLDLGCPTRPRRTDRVVG